MDRKDTGHGPSDPRTLLLGDVCCAQGASRPTLPSLPPLLLQVLPPKQCFPTVAHGATFADLNKIYDRECIALVQGLQTLHCLFSVKSPWLQPYCPQDGGKCGADVCRAEASVGKSSVPTVPTFTLATALPHLQQSNLRKEWQFLCSLLSQTRSLNSSCPGAKLTQNPNSAATLRSGHWTLPHCPFRTTARARRAPLFPF